MIENQFRLVLVSPTDSYTHRSESDKVKIGRGMGCDFVVPREDLSREHCIVEKRGDSFYITDLGSKNGTYVNRVKLAAHARTEVKEDTLVVLSNIYTLKLNVWDIKTKVDLLLRKNNEIIMETMSFQLESDGTQARRKNLKKRQNGNHSAEAPSKTKASKKKTAIDDLKMLAAFVIILYMIYHFFGR